MNDDPNDYGFVYFIQAEHNGLIKIGTATNVLSRLADMQIGCPIQLTLLGIRQGGRNAERALHVRFAVHRVRGEWFQPSDDILAYVAECDEPISADHLTMHGGIQKDMRRQAVHRQRLRQQREMKHALEVANLKKLPAVSAPDMSEWEAFRARRSQRTATGSASRTKKSRAG